jgi:hypothetical protein
MGLLRKVPNLNKNLNKKRPKYSTGTNSVADPDPGSGAIFTAGSGIRIRDEQTRSYFRELRNHFFGLKCLNSLMRIRDPESEM